MEVVIKKLVISRKDNNKGNYGTN